MTTQEITQKVEQQKISILEHYGLSRQDAINVLSQLTKVDQNAQKKMEHAR